MARKQDSKTVSFYATSKDADFVFKRGEDWMLCFRDSPSRGTYLFIAYIPDSYPALSICKETSAEGEKTLIQADKDGWVASRLW